uniref:Uncharacterized protein n=1 Tax=Brassica oleracea var. oleracea TaxID=109376 RepID=A0A0D3DCL9_BRAOL
MAESPKYIEPYDCREAVAISPKLSLSFVLLNPGLQRIPPVFKPSDGLSGSHVRRRSIRCTNLRRPILPRFTGASRRVSGLRRRPSSGLSVSYLSGTESSDGQFGKYSQDDVDALRALADDSGVVDFLFTNEWPVGVTNRAAESDIPTEVSDSSCCDSNVSELVKEVKPRYPIAGSMGGVLCP